MLETAESFWKLVSKDILPKVKNFALKMHSMFGNTHVCESTFSTMKQVKSKNKNRMAYGPYSLTQAGFTIRLKRLKPRAPDFGGPQILGVKTISSISVSNYICIFVLVQRTLFYYAANKRSL